MIKKITLSLITSSMIFAAEIELSPLNVEATIITEVAKNAQLSADLAQALSTSVPSIDMSRRSGIANDILIRGQTRDNISVSVDGTKVQGACVNRMDPPISHIITSQIQDVEVIEGPYDVENFGTMSGGVKIKTKKPTKGVKGEANLAYGAFNYLKFGASASGGNDYVRMLVSASTESSNQYKDGNGNTLAGQIQKNADANPSDRTATGAVLKQKYKNMKAYTKSSFMTKMFIKLAQNQELRLGYTANRSDGILYANTKMDAVYDNSNIYNVKYILKNLSDSYKKLSLQYYESDVDHPMATKFRVSSKNQMMNNTNHLRTKMQGVKLKNNFEVANYKLLVGLDGSQRYWAGNYYNTSTKAPRGQSLSATTTTNMALFTKLDKSFDALDMSFGLRYNSTQIIHANSESRNYTSLNANLINTYHVDEENKLFLGIGRASRVPDARELYFRNIKNTGTDTVGTANLNQTTNTELDLGYELQGEMIGLKVKGFYSMLHNYIYIQKGKLLNAFHNVNATVYGAELSASYYPTDELTLDLGASYKLGNRKKSLAGQTGTNLANIAPLRGTLNLSYEYMNQSVASMGVRASETWKKYDGENGEQKLAAWAVLDMKVRHRFNKVFDFTLGANNLLNATYAQSNTYANLTLVTSGSTGKIMLLNEPGRYIYTNLNAKF